MAGRKMPTLLPCPLCGGAASIVTGRVVNPDHEWAHGAFHRAFCTRCQVRQYYHRTEEEAAEAWNTRPAPQPDAIAEARREGMEEIDRYRKALGMITTYRAPPFHNDTLALRAIAQNALDRAAATAAQREGEK